MIAPDPNSLCRIAEPYYYDYGCVEDIESVPAEIRAHIDKCSHCRNKTDHLESWLAKAMVSFVQNTAETNLAKLSNLKLHLAYIDRRVGCNTVKPFLPGLLDPALKISIPTPITAHLDNCPQCSEDLEAIRDLGLTRIQLYRLSHLFTEEPSRCSSVDPEMEKVVRSIAAMDFGGATAEALEHLCKCTVCRDSLFELRRKDADGLQEQAQAGEFPCESVGASDVFDYCFPYGIDPADDQYAGFRSSFTSHVLTCRTCLAKMQEVHKIVGGIIEQPESGLITVYHVDESAEARTGGQSDDPYAGFPISVELISPEQIERGQQFANGEVIAALKSKIPAMSFRPLLKAGLAIAAAVLIVCALFINMPTAKGVTIRQIYEAIEKIKNVHISSFVPGKSEPIQERWVSRASNIYIVKTGDQFVLWDLGNGLKKSKQTRNANIQTTRLSAEDSAWLERRVRGTLGLVPFDDISQIPPDAEWARVTEKQLESVVEGIEIYDLAWTTAGPAGSEIFRKWRVFIDRKTDLPRRTESFEKLTSEDEYVPIVVQVIECLSDSEMQTILREFLAD